MTVKINVQGDDTYLLTVKAGVLLYRKGTKSDNADVTVTLPKAAVALLLSPDDLFANENVAIEGDQEAFQKMYGYMTEFDPYFNIIEP
jgi:alkyl sulfatase BDS1-like metallo-beta-lactamase superfamily hydrolase